MSNKKPCNVEVKQRKGEDPSRLIKRFVKKTQKSGVIQEILERRRFKKPSQKRHDKDRKMQHIRRKEREAAEKAKYSKGGDQ